MVHKVGAAASLVGTGHIHVKGRARGPRKSTGSKRFTYEHTGGDDYSQKSQKWVVLDRLIDRERDIYREKVTDPETGLIIHHVEGRLTDHQDHGDARKRRRPK